MKTILRKTVKDWLDSIENKDIRKIAADSVIVTGGSIASMLRGETVNDFDLYFANRNAVVAMANYYAEAHAKHVNILYGERRAIYKEKIMDEYDLLEWDPRLNFYTMVIENLERNQVAFHFNSRAGYEVKIEDDKKRKPYSPLFFSANAITLTNQIQLILRFHGEPAKIHENFDFLHATNYYNYGTDELVFNVDAVLAATTGELHYVGSKYPLTSIIRIKKFLARGYTINAGEQLKIMFQLSQLNLTDPVVLSNQLAGVDITYFTLLINKMIEAGKDPLFKIDSTWLNNIIDGLFNMIEHDED